jgi:hypothetical protein
MSAVRRRIVFFTEWSDGANTPLNVVRRQLEGLAAPPPKCRGIVA